MFPPKHTARGLARRPQHRLAVAIAAKGQMAVYDLSNPFSYGKLSVFDSFEAASAVLPPDVIGDTKIRAGLDEVDQLDI